MTHSHERVATDDFNLNINDLHAHSIPALVPYAIAAVLIPASGIVISIFYCLGAMHGERRDRSILFWKSLPVSDLVTVLAKLSVPALVIPAVVFVLVAASHLIIFAYSTIAWASAGQDAIQLWSQVPLLRLWIMCLYALVAVSLWHLPAWGWLLMVSAWARKMPILWAFGVPIALSVLEQIAFNTKHVSHLFWDRLVGGLGVAFDVPQHPATLELSYMTPLRLIASPGLWLGLVVGAAFIAATVWIRRRAEPL